VGRHRTMLDLIPHGVADLLVGLAMMFAAVLLLAGLVGLATMRGRH